MPKNPHGLILSILYNNYLRSGDLKYKAILCNSMVEIASKVVKLDGMKERVKKALLASAIYEAQNIALQKWTEHKAYFEKEPNELFFSKVKQHGRKSIQTHNVIGTVESIEGLAHPFALHCNLFAEVMSEIDSIVAEVLHKCIEEGVIGQYVINVGFFEGGIDVRNE